MEAAEPPKEPSLLSRIRNMWEFANLVQWIFIFGRVVKIDENLDIEVRPKPSHAIAFKLAVLSALMLMLVRVGSGDGMSKKPLNSSPGAWPFAPQICLLASRLNVSTLHFHTLSNT